ncbi:MAG TPA: hypothetical protein VFV99_14550 [Kofleriaceae bacterium]|nr:hypothetical protein [Kofleriaceae bacterium]
MRHALALVVLVGCTDNTVVVTPIIDIPANDDAQPLDLDTITLSIAHAGAADDITSATFSHGDVIELPNVPYGDDLVVHMVGRRSNSEYAYGRTCEFSVRPDARLPTPHLFFARQVKFGEMSQQPLPRIGGQAMMYRDGSGLLVGGEYPDENNKPLALTQIERFDPSTGAYDNLHDIERRYDAAVAIVGTGADSRMVIVGGLDPATGVGAEFAEVIEAERNTDRQYEKFFEPRLNRTRLTATTLSDGRAVVIGGYQVPDPAKAIAGGPSNIVAQVSVDTGTTAITALRAQLKYPRYSHTATRLTDELGAAVLVAGGLDANGKPIKEAELYKPLFDNFSDQFTAQMIVPRWNHQVARLPDGSVLFIGGLTINPMTGQTEIADQLELFSPLDGRFISVGLLSEKAPTAGRIGMSATVLPDGRVLITGGAITVDADGKPGPPVDTAFIASLDPLDGQLRVVATDNLAVPRMNHQATPLCDGTVLISGGTVGQATYERYNPAAIGRR